jgi:cold shock CspA family protein
MVVEQWEAGVSEADRKLTRIGVFYDGNFFSHVSNYYTYHHERRARLSIGGLHHFIRTEVARCENVDSRFCQIVDAHYFRGRVSANEAEQRNILRSDRAFDDVLMREGVVTHYLPLTPTGEKGIDVWLALEVLELAVYKRFNVSVLITGDRDFVPLIRKLNTLGTRVMLLGWSFKYTNDRGEERATETSQQLLEEVTYPILMSDEIDDRTRKNDPLIANLFLPKKESRLVVPDVHEVAVPADAATGTIMSLKEGFGFIKSPGAPDNLFFHHSDVVNRDFNDLTVGDSVTCSIEKTDRGYAAKKVTLS